MKMVPLLERTPIDDACHVMPVFGHKEHRLVLVQETEFPSIDAGFALELFDGLAIQTGEAPVDRTASVLSILKRLDLVSSAHVLWSADPFTDESAVPLSTLYVKGGSAFTNETQLQHNIDAALKRTDSIPGSSLYPREAEGSKSVFAGSGAYRFIVPARHEALTVVLTQLRLQQVADTNSHRNGRAIESVRRFGYQEYLEELEG